MQAIEVSFSAESGGDSIGITDEYDVDTGVSVSEDATAEFGDLNIEDHRQIYGSGDAKATQSYTGTDCSGQASYKATGATNSLSSAVTLKPHSLIVSQSLSSSGDQVDSSLSIVQGGSQASVSGSVTAGSMSASQLAWTGSAHAVQFMSGSGTSVSFQGQANLGELQSIIGASTAGYQGTIGASADGAAYVAEHGTLTGGYNLLGTAGTLNGDLTMTSGSLGSDLYAYSDPLGRQELFTGLIDSYLDEASSGSEVVLPSGYRWTGCGHKQEFEDTG